MLQGYHFTVQRYEEEDGTVTLSLNEIDLVENAENEYAASILLGRSILEYAEEYYDQYELYSRAPNRREHVPYVFMALLINDAEKLAEEISCQAGKN